MSEIISADLDESQNSIFWCIGGGKSVFPQIGGIPNQSLSEGTCHQNEDRLGLWQHVMEWGFYAVSASQTIFVEKTIHLT